MSDAVISDLVYLASDSVSGLRWKRTVSSRAVKDAPALAYVSVRGYCIGMIQSKPYAAHRVVYYLANGSWPDVVDHIDGDKLNNQPANLRSGSVSANARNRVGKGYTPVMRRGVRMYAAQISIQGKVTPLGVYSTAKKARAVYLAMKRVVHPESIPRLNKLK